MYIFMEYCDEGTLEEVSRLGLQEHVIRLYSKQITTAINVLHEHGIVHRDIKGQCHMLFIIFSYQKCRKFRVNSASFFLLLITSLFFVFHNRSQHLFDIIWPD